MYVTNRKKGKRMSKMNFFNLQPTEQSREASAWEKAHPAMSAEDYTYFKMPAARRRALGLDTFPSQTAMVRSQVPTAALGETVVVETSMPGLPDLQSVPVAAPVALQPATQRPHFSGGPAFAHR